MRNDVFMATGNRKISDWGMLTAMTVALVVKNNLNQTRLLQLFFFLGARWEGVRSFLAVFL